MVFGNTFPSGLVVSVGVGPSSGLCDGFVHDSPSGLVKVFVASPSSGLVRSVSPPSGLVEVFVREPPSDLVEGSRSPWSGLVEFVVIPPSGLVFVPPPSPPSPPSPPPSSLPWESAVRVLLPSGVVALQMSPYLPPSHTRPHDEPDPLSHLSMLTTT